MFYMCKEYLLFFSCSVVSDSLWPRGLQHARLPCPPLSTRVCSDSYALSRWFHPTISSSVAPFSFCPQSFPASESFPMSWLFASMAKVLKLQHQSFQWVFRIETRLVKADVSLRYSWLDLEHSGLPNFFTSQEGSVKESQHNKNSSSWRHIYWDWVNTVLPALPQACF